MNLYARNFELASAGGAQLSDRIGAQKPSQVEHSRGKGWDVPGAAACAKGCDGEELLQLLPGVPVLARS